MRILMVNYEYPPLGGGSGNATFHLLRELAGEPGLRVDLLTSGIEGRQEPEEAFPNVVIRRIPVAKRDPHFWTAREIAGWSLRALLRSGDLVRENRYDLCHCWAGWPSGFIGYRHRARIPYIIALRGSDVPGYNARLRGVDPLLFRPVSRSIWRNAAAVTSVSRDLLELARRTDPALACEVIHNGVDVERFRPGEQAGRFIVLYIGRLIKRKGLLDLLDAFRRVSRGDGGCLLRVAGSGPQRKRLEAFCREAGIDDRVEFLGPVEGDDLARLYREASLFVMPSHEEAMSNAALEAMASGLPIITTRTGVSEIIDGNGIVVEKGRPDQIAPAIERYLGDKDLRKRHGGRSREIVETMTWASVAKAYRELYERVLSGRRH
ncbi:MAG: glycosyltransferase family 4 protein [Candidatus Eisenbacteria bacterium]